jgi:hypothetical protein
MRSPRLHVRFGVCSALAHLAFQVATSGAVAEAGPCDGAGNLPTGEMVAGTTDAVLFPNFLEPGDHFGEALAVGDFNGDGIEDLAVGAPDADYTGLTNAGAVAIYYGALNFTPACPTSPCTDAVPVFDAPDVKLRGPTTGGRMGRALANAGDVTGDGVDDLLVGGVGAAHLVDITTALPDALVVSLHAFEPASPTPSFGGMVGRITIGSTTRLWVADPTGRRVFLYRTDQPLFPETLSIDWQPGFNKPITAVEAIGDYDSDGLADLAMGCGECTVAMGHVVVLEDADLTGTTDLDASTGVVIDRIAWDLGRAGTALAGFPGGMLLVGAPKAGASAGRVGARFQGTPSTYNANSWGTMGGAGGSHLGAALAVGNFENTSTDRFAAGAPLARLGNATRGAVRVSGEVLVPGTISGTLTVFGPPNATTGTSSGFGEVLARVDLNGDLFDDLVIAAPDARALDGNGTLKKAGAVFVLYGGADGYTGTEITQYRDADADGWGGGPPVIRCELLSGYVLNGGDCGDTNPEVNGLLEICAGPEDEDCEPANNQICNSRSNQGPTGPVTPEPVGLSGSTWCYRERVRPNGETGWVIGPDGETVTVQDLAVMLDEETLFMEDPLADGVVSAVAPASTCAGSTSGVSVTLDVMTNYLDNNGGVDTQRLMGAGYRHLLTDVVIDTLHSHSDGYLVGNLRHGPEGTHLLVLGGDYPGLVNGVVDLLRATEDGLQWDHRVVMDYPENPIRRLRSGANLVNCAKPAGAPWNWDAEVTEEAWRNCDPSQLGVVDPSEARQAMDTAIRYHFSVVEVGDLLTTAVKDTELRAELGLTYPFSTPNAIRYTANITNLRELALFYRRRGIDLHPVLGLAPGGGGTDGDHVPPDIWAQTFADLRIEPNAIWNMAFHPVSVEVSPGVLEDIAFPCDDDDCSGEHEEVVGDVIRTEKYMMKLSGDGAGVVYPRNLLRPPIWVERTSIPGFEYCDAITVGGAPPVDSAQCAGPCVCMRVTDDAQMASAPAGELVFSPGVSDTASILLAQNTLTAEVAPPLNDDGAYGVWNGDDGDIRPGRLYSFRARAEHVQAAANASDALVTLSLAVLANPALDAWSSTFTLPPGGTEHLHFTFRAPLVPTEAIDVGADNVEPWGNNTYHPALRIATALREPALGGSTATIRLFDVTLVELDGQSGGWMDAPDAPPPGAPALRAEGLDVVTAVDVTASPSGCAYGAPDVCVPLQTSHACPAPASPVAYEDLPTASWERFARQPETALATTRIWRLRVDEDADDIVRVSGVQRPLLGAVPIDPCDGTPPSGMQISGLFPKQSPALLSDAAWDRDGFGFSSQLAFIDTDWQLLNGVTLREYLYDDTYLWHLPGDLVRTNLMSEVVNYNLSFAAWEEGVYRPISHHQVIRAVTCNAARRVAMPNWSSTTNLPYLRYCDFASAGEDCLTDDLASLTDDTDCPLPPNATSARVIFDSNMYNDATTLQYDAMRQVRNGGLAATYLVAELKDGQPTVPANATLPATLASNVDTNVWAYYNSFQEIMEQTCDVQDISDIFVSHPELNTTYGADNASRHACMMTGRMIDSAVHGLAGVGAEDDSVRRWSSFSAGHPDVVASVGVVKFEGPGGGVLARFDDPSWSYAAECLWNPEWRLLEVVSLGDLVAGVAGSRWCPGGSKAIGNEPITMIPEEEPYDPRGQLCEDFPFNNSLSNERADCVYGDEGSADTRLTMIPTYAAAVDLRGANRIRVSVPTGIGPHNAIYAVERSSCLGASYFDTGTHNSVGQTVPPVPVGPQAMAGPSRLRLFFYNASGTIVNLAPGDNYEGSVPCSSTFDWATTDPAFLVPLVARPDLDPESEGRQRLRLQAEVDVPQGAVRVGVALWVRTVEGIEFYEPIIGSIAVEAALDDDPNWASAIHLGNRLEHEGNGNVPADNTLWPARCESSRWYRGSFARATEPLTKACYESLTEVNP